MNLTIKHVLSAALMSLAFMSTAMPPGFSSDLPKAKTNYPFPKMSPDGVYSAISFNQHLRLVSTRDDKIKWLYPDPRGTQKAYSITGVCWSPDGAKLAVAGGGAIRVLDASNGHEIYTFSGLKGSTFGPDWSKDGKYLAAIGIATGGNPDSKEMTSVVVWDAATQKSLVEIPQRAGSMVLWAPDNQRLAFNTNKGNVQIWDALHNKNLVTIPTKGNGRPPLDWSPDGRYLVIADWKTDEAVIFDAQTGEALAHRPVQGFIVEFHWAKSGKAITGVPMAGPDEILDLEFEPNGKIKMLPPLEITPGESI